MTTRTKRNRLKIAKLRACVMDGKPWAIMPSALSSMIDAFTDGDAHDVEASLSFGNDIEATARVVNGTAVIPVTGVLRDEVDYMVKYGYASAYQVLERDIAAAVNDSQIKAVVLFMSTPGGSAIGCKRVADAIHSMRGRKPIVAYSQSICGSAGYYIASACDRMEGTADSLWGSIGTIMTHFEQSKMMEDFGIGVTTITNRRSPSKGHGNSYASLTPESRKTLDDFIDSYGEGFISDVAIYRGVTPEQVVSRFGQGDAFRADIAIDRGMIDAVVPNLQVTLNSLSNASSAVGPVAEALHVPESIGLTTNEETSMKITLRIRAQLLASGLIASMEATDETCQAALSAWFVARNQTVPADENDTIKGLQAVSASTEADDDDVDDDEEETDGDEDEEPTATVTKPKPKATAKRRKIENAVQQAHESEQGEARLADLSSAAALINQAAGKTIVTAEMVLKAMTDKLNPSAAMVVWNQSLATEEPAVPTSRVNVTGTGSDRFAEDAVNAMLYRASDNPSMELSAGAAAMANRPLWAVAGHSLEVAGLPVDMYGSREQIAEDAMAMGDATRRQTFFSGSEDRRYAQNASIPATRPGDFPNILSNLANKFLDTVQLDDDFSYTQVSALLPGGLNDFKPALMINKGVVEELDELQDAEQFKDLGLEEEVLSYIFLRRFGNRFGWTPVMVANDDLNAFAEGMLGMAEAWQVTQNRLVVDRFTSNENLLDGSPLFADRADTGVGANKATNNNVISSGTAPSDAAWESMEELYADIGGINTGRRVRGSLNTIFTPTGTTTSEATRHFGTLNIIGENKQAATTANLGLYRGKVNIVPESELRVSSKITYYGLRNPTRLNTATVVRAYFNGFGTQGRRERWYDPSNKTTYISLEGRIATAVKNWRYAVKNPGNAG